MCIFNIVLDDKIVNAAKSSFSSEKSMTAWMEEQLSILLLRHASEDVKEKERTPRKHDALMGILNNVADMDSKRIHIKEKYDYESIL